VPSVAVQDLACVDDGQADDPLDVWRKAKDVSFLGSSPSPGWLTDV
jgi:hypothetical protein